VEDDLVVEEVRVEVDEEDGGITSAHPRALLI